MYCPDCGSPLRVTAHIGGIMHYRCLFEQHFFSYEEKGLLQFHYDRNPLEERVKEIMERPKTEEPPTPEAGI